MLAYRYICPMAAVVYFISDLHFGADSKQCSSREREVMVADWLDGVESGAIVYFLGDIFDYWFEYEYVVPAGYTIFLSALRRTMDRGVTIEFFTGNHDMWMKDYFPEEYGIPIHRASMMLDLQGCRCMIGHGDGLGPGDISYKWMKKIFANRQAQYLYSCLHPNTALSIMKRVSKTSAKKPEADYHPDNEMLIHYCEKKLRLFPDIDYFVFGHRHLIIDRVLHNGHSRYINLGEWLHYMSYARLEDGNMEILFHQKKHTVCT